MWIATENSKIGLNRHIAGIPACKDYMPEPRKTGHETRDCFRYSHIAVRMHWPGSGDRDRRSREWAGARRARARGRDPGAISAPSEHSYSRDVSDVLNTDSKNIENPNFDFSNITDTEGRLIVHFFYLPKCSACLGIKPEIDRLESAYPDTVFKRYDLTTPNGSVAYNTFANQLNLSKSQRYVPQVLVNGTVITDRFNINSTLETIVKGYG
jgi:thiol-disulfide isomerase/thioredoxin